MKPLVLTLFGEAYEPEPVKASKTRASKTTKPKKEEEQKVKIDYESNLPTGWQATKHYYSISEVAELYRVNVSKIRYWTNEFALKVRTTQKGDRLYNAQDIDDLNLIYTLVKRRGYTIAGAKAKLKEQKSKLTDEMRLKQELSKLKEQLTALRQQLH
jgi:DNA-binding transcriptional MerR regulator